MASKTLNPSLKCYRTLILLIATAIIYFSIYTLFPYKDEFITLPTYKLHTEVTINSDKCFHNIINCHNATVNVTQYLNCTDMRNEDKTGFCRGEDESICKTPNTSCDTCVTFSFRGRYGARSCFSKLVKDNCKYKYPSQTCKVFTYDMIEKCGIKHVRDCDCKFECEEWYPYTQCEVGTNYKSNCVYVKKDVYFYNSDNQKQYLDVYNSNSYIPRKYQLIYDDHIHCKLNDTKCIDIFNEKYPTNRYIGFYNNKPFAFYPTKDNMRLLRRNIQFKDGKYGYEDNYNIYTIILGIIAAIYILTCACVTVLSKVEADKHNIHFCCNWQFIRFFKWFCYNGNKTTKKKTRVKKQVVFNVNTTPDNSVEMVTHNPHLYKNKHGFF